MKTIKIDAQVTEVRELKDGSYQVWVQVGDYNPCLYLSKEEAEKQGITTN